MQSIKNMFEQFRLQRFVLDFEDAVWKALNLKSYFLTKSVYVRGVLFTLHSPFGAIFKKKDCSVHAYTNDDGAHKFFRKVMALCVLCSCTHSTYM
ncbi:hypothetical protein LSH36_540g01127 [Paralvinella palmiformis]|uniref:Uncharacterized protein n=1 Tax=Paralvinella palmiformis TaxID=53620 RepID=A0AAD9J764_9ANNE|nr:hypothetical protein LSH36_540g01127 [Paralvinella palmiformis]